MKLSELLKNINPTTIKGSTEVEITGVNIDSRKDMHHSIRLLH